MNEPPRMRDDPDADAELRALLREASETPGMPEAARRMLGAKLATYGGATALPAHAALAGWKWVGIAALVAVSSAGVWRANSTTAPRAPVPSAVVAVTPTSRATPQPVTAREPPTVVTPAVGVPAPPPAAHRRAHAPPVAEPVTEPVAPPVAAAPSEAPVAEEPLAAGVETNAEVARRSAEHQLLDRARAAVTSGRVDEALRLVAEHEQRFSEGRLVEEREVIALEALSRAGRRDEVRSRGERFLSSTPRSLYAPRVRRLVRDASGI